MKAAGSIPAWRTKSKKPPGRATSCAFCGKRESDPQGASVSPRLRWSFGQRAVRRRPNGEPRKQPASERKEESASRRSIPAWRTKSKKPPGRAVDVIEQNELVQAVIADFPLFNQNQRLKGIEDKILFSNL